MSVPASFYVTQGFMMACSGSAALIGYSRKSRHPYLNFFYLYPLTSFAQSIIFYITASYFFNSRATHIILTNFSCNLFLLIEFLVIYQFYQRLLKTHYIKKILYSISGIYVLTVLYFWFIAGSYFSTPRELYFIQAFFILIPVLIYFFELIKWPVNHNLLTEASFWISTGILFYFASTLPLFLVQSFIGKEIRVANLYLINFIAYGFMFLLIAKAYLCPKRDTP
jgi:hypothetical protein